MALGAILREERERRGLTEHQVADATRMMVQMVRELEEEDFHRIAAPIYGRGFVKLYAAFLEMDPAPLVKEFEEIYARRGQRAAPAPRVPLERFGAGAGTGLERVEPTEAPVPAPPVDSSESIRIPAPKAVRPLSAAMPVPKPAPAPPPPPPSDLFGERIDDPVPEAPPPEPDARVFSVPRPASAGGGPGRPTMATPASAPAAGARRSVLDSASHRFEGHPYRPGLVRMAGVWLGRLVGLLARGIARIIAGIGLGVGSGIRAMGGKAGSGWRALGRLPWARIGRVALKVAPVVLVVGGLAAGIRSCIRNRSEMAREAAILDPAVVLERILPPPPGYAD